MMILVPPTNTATGVDICAQCQEIIRRKCRVKTIEQIRFARYHRVNSKPCG